MSRYHIGLFGCAGSGKSSVGLSFPGVEQHVFGSSEEFTAENFPERKKAGDILAPLKLDWMDFLTPAEKEQVFSETSMTIADEFKIKELEERANCRMIIKYRRYILKLKNDLKSGLRPELKSVFLDNATPFCDTFADYVKITKYDKFVTKGDNWDSIKFSIEYGKDLMDFMKLFNELECNTVMSFHIKLAMDQDDAAKANFMEDSKKGIRYAKEWLPMVPGQSKYNIAGKFDYCFYMWAEENPGQANKYFAKLEADSANVGIGKSRVQPFEKPSRIELPKNSFYSFFCGAMEKKLGVGK